MPKNMLEIKDVSESFELEKSQKSQLFLQLLNVAMSHEVLTPINCILTFANRILGVLKDQEIKPLIC